MLYTFLHPSVGFSKIRCFMQNDVDAKYNRPMYFDTELYTQAIL